MKTAHEYAVATVLRETGPAVKLSTPDEVARYWREHVATGPGFDPEKEHFVVLLLDVRSRLKGHHLISVGLLNQCLVDARAVFRPAIAANAYSVTLLHNHPSGNATPSEADIRITRDLIRAGQILKVEVLDHVVLGQVGDPERPAGHASLRELGYF